jgi:uncharacterized protein (TIGR02246 family)
MSDIQDNVKDLAAINELHEKDLKASRAKDFDILLSLWTEDGILLEPGKEPIVGIDAIRAYIDEQSQASQDYTINKYEHHWMEIKVIGDWAFEWGFFEAEAKMVAGGKVIRDHGKLFRLLKRQKDGSWKAARAIFHNDPFPD